MNNFNYFTKKRTLLLSSLPLAISSMLVAQSVVAETGQELRTIEEVVVSARRRDESLQDVPVAVTAFGAEQIKERGIETEADLQMSTPGLMIRPTSSSNQLSYSLRGQSIDAISYSAPAVLAYVNEVQAGGVSASTFFDLESIQVLKGPQGTLFGRNATGGAVLYQTKRPENEFGGYIKVGVGNYSNREVEGAVNIPLSENLSVRLAGLTRERDGWQQNLYDNKDLASIDTDNVRLSILYETDNFENQFVGYVGEHGGRPEGLKIKNAYAIGQTNNGITLNPTAQALYPAGILASPIFNPADNPGVVAQGFDGIADFIEKQKAADFHDVYNNTSASVDTDHEFYSNTTTFEISDSLTIKNIFGYNSVESFQAVDVDGNPFMILEIGDESGDFRYFYDTKQVSNEFQISGQLLDDKLDYIVGFFISEDKFFNRNPLKVAADYQSFAEPAPGLFFYSFEIKDESKAIFFQGTYALTDALNFTAGYRHTWEDISITQASDDFNANVLGVKPASTKFDRPSWNLSLDYRFNEESMMYVSTRGSWRTGGFNGTSVLAGPGGFIPGEFDSETTWDVEAGYKFSGYIGTVPSRINIAVYEQRIEDVQRTVYLNITSVTGNVKKAKVTGIEIDTTFDLTDWLRVGAAYAYTDARYTDGQADVDGFSLDFGPYADTPEESFSAYFLTTHNLDIGQLTFRGDFYSVSEAYFSNLDDTIAPGTDLDGYELINVRIALEEVAGSNLTAVAFVRNATDEEYNRGGYPLGGVIGVNSTSVGEPRTVGFELSYSF